jgi:hypothetical protein
MEESIKINAAPGRPSLDCFVSVSSSLECWVSIRRKIFFWTWQCQVALWYRIMNLFVSIFSKLQTYGYYLAYFWMNDNLTRNSLGVKEVNLLYVLLFFFPESICSIVR